MKILIIFSFVCIVCAHALPDLKRKDYLESLKSIQTHYEIFMKMANDASWEGKNKATYVTLMLSAVIDLGIEYNKKPQTYNATYVPIAIKGMVKAMRNVNNFKKQLKDIYGNRIYRNHLRYFVELKDKLCPLSEIYKCNDIMNQFFRQNVVEPKYWTARSVLFATADAGKMIWDPTQSPNSSLQDIATKSHPELYFLDHPQTLLPNVQKVALVMHILNEKPIKSEE